MASMNRFAFAVAALAFAAVISGCGNGGEEKPAEVQKPADAEVKTDDQTLFVIDGKPLKASFVRDSVLVVAKIYELAKHKVSSKAFNVWANRTAMRISRKLVSVMLIDGELDRIGFKATPESDAETLDRYRRMTRTKAATVDEMARQFGDLKDFFRAQFNRESRFSAYMDSKGLDEVSDRELVRFYRTASNRYEQCQQINKTAYARANEAWERLNKGESWDNVATNYTEDALIEKTYADNWQNWMVVGIDKVTPPELAMALKPLKKGDFTKPIMTEEGLAIVRVNDVDEVSYDLARILIRSAIDYEIPDRETAVKVIRRHKREEFQEKLVEDLKKKTNVEFPLGTNFTYKIWE